MLFFSRVHINTCLVVNAARPSRPLLRAEINCVKYLFLSLPSGRN